MTSKLTLWYYIPSLLLLLIATSPVLSQELSDNYSTLSDKGDTKVAIADYDGDADMDLFVGENFVNTSQVVLVRNNNYNWNNDLVVLTIESEDTIALKAIHVADINGDGWPDILARLDFGVHVWYSKTNQTGSNWVFEEMLTSSSNSCILRTSTLADLDADGDKDLVFQDCDTGEMMIMQNDGSGIFSPATMISSEPTAYYLFAEDIDGDDDLDLISESELTGDIIWMENMGGLNFSEPNILANFNADFVTLKDLNSDGLPDIMASSQTETLWFENEGNGLFSDQILVSEISSNSILALDLNVDGDVELVRSSNFTVMANPRLAWFPQESGPEFGPEQIIEEFNLISNLAQLDMDGDGDEDVIARIVVNAGSRLVWFQNLQMEGRILDTVESCETGSNGAIIIELTENLFPPYQYSWSLNDGEETGAGIVDDEIFSINMLAIGIYDLIISNAVGDIVLIEDVEILNQLGVFMEYTQINTTNSSNNLPNGGIEVTWFGGSPPYSISWTGESSGSGTADSTFFDLGFLPAGDYQILVNSDPSSIFINVTLLDEIVPQETCNTAMDIVILNDVSGSVDAIEYDQSKTFFVALLNGLNLGLEVDEARAAIIEWSSSGLQDVVYDMTGDFDVLSQYEGNSRQFTGGTDPQNALNYGYNYLTNVERPEATKIMILSTDGTSGQVSNSFIALADQYKAQGYIIVTIAFDSAFQDSTTREILSAVASNDVLAPGAQSYAELTEQLAFQIVNLYVCPSDPGSSGTVFLKEMVPLRSTSFLLLASAPIQMP